MPTASFELGLRVEKGQVDLREHKENQMKKLMTIAAAALCGVAFAEGEIASANIVG